jgi:polysaccharide pyruvyl transferase WcaK-like protein
VRVMSGRDLRAGRRTGPRPARVGLFGQFGSGNIGNDASLEAALHFLATAHPDTAVDVMCGGPQDVQDRYGVPARALLWYSGRASGIAASALKALVKVADSWRIVGWVRRHDVVIIPGMGVFEGSLPAPPWSEPLRLFLVSLSGRVFGTRVGYVSVGADDAMRRPTRWLFTQAARLATYCSCRDSRSREVLCGWGVDTAGIPVYPDLAFALPVPPPQVADPKVVCVGVMEYHGGDDDQGREETIRDAYITEMTLFVRCLLQAGREVRLLVGDANGSDDTVIQEIMANIRQSMPGTGEGRLVAWPAVSLADILAAMRSADSVVAIRFHNVVAALMLGKPTIAISYGAKHQSLMEDFGIAEFCTPVKTLDHERLASLFTRLSDNAAHLRAMLIERKAVSEQLLAEQFTGISGTLINYSQDMTRPSRSSSRV